MISHLDNNNFKDFTNLALFAISLIIVFILYRFLFNYLKRKVQITPSKRDDFMLNLFRIPSLWFIYWIMLKIYTHIFLSDFTIYPYLVHFNAILLIFSVAWITIQGIKAAAYYMQSKLDITASDNLNARTRLTQIKVFRNILNSIIVTIAFSVALMTFEQARNIGLSLLTSAGIFGIIVGFAAQKSIGMILAGIQLAITQPIRLDDVVIVEGEWGRIEEITLTYVVVKIWDERRLVLPVNYFLEKPFQNWTRSSADIIGTIFITVDYSFPVEALRRALPAMIQDNPDWDKRMWNVQVTKTTENYKEVRILVSSADASKNWDLRTAVREQLIDFINENYPETFAKIRIKQV